MLLSTMTLKLFVYIPGLAIPSFSVIMEGSDNTVDDLKKAIVNEVPKDLSDVNAHHLVLYKVDLPDAPYEVLQKEVLFTPRVNLMPSEMLSELFPGSLPMKMIQIIVKVPGLGE